MSTILVVDDELAIRESLSALLSGIEGVECIETATKADEAIQIAARQPPDLLIVDWMLGGDMDGYQLAEKLQETQPRLEIIFVTGYLSEHLNEKIRTMPNAQVFSKPCPHEEFMKAIVDALSRAEKGSE